MRIERRYTAADQGPYAGLDFRFTRSEIRNPDGSVVFKLENVEVPGTWSQVASDVLAQKYFRKAGVPARLKKVEENDVPSFLWRSTADEAAFASLPEAERYIGETSSKQVFDRLAGTWTYWGWKGGYFDSEADASSFYDELRFMLANQMVAPNSPQWFNTGLHWAYGIDGPSQGHYYVDFKTGKLTKSKSSYEHPQPHACFIQGVEDDLVNDGGIMDLWVREARLFKYGSGTGSNFSKPARREREAVGRRQVVGPDVLPQDRRPRRRRHQVGRHHAPRREDGRRRHRSSRYRELHRLEGEGGAEGRGARRPARRSARKHMKAIMKACVNCDGPGDDCFDPERNPALKKAIKLARRVMIPTTTSSASSSSRSRATRTSPSTSTTPTGIPTPTSRFPARTPTTRCALKDDFLRAVETDGDWNLTARKDGKHHQDAEGARPLGEDRLRRLGLRRSRASSSTPPSTTGTPARPPVRSARRTPARNTCSSTTPRATSPR